MSNNIRLNNLITASVPAMAAGASRVPLDAPYKAAGGSQWVVLSDGNTEWCGPEDQVTAPTQAIIDAVVAEYAAAIPTISVDTSSQVIAADNAATGTVVVTDSRGAAASGKVVKVRLPPGGSAGIDCDCCTLAGSGQATLTFQATSVFTGDLSFELYYASGEVVPIRFTVRRGSA